MVILQVNIRRIVDGMIARVIERSAKRTRGDAFLTGEIGPLEGKIPPRQLPKEVVVTVIIAVCRHTVVRSRIIQFWKEQPLAAAGIICAREQALETVRQLTPIAQPTFVRIVTARLTRQFR